MLHCCHKESATTTTTTTATTTTATTATATYTLWIKYVKGAKFTGREIVLF
jgi:hypothetical protein